MDPNLAASLVSNGPVPSASAAAPTPQSNPAKAPPPYALQPAPSWTQPSINSSSGPSPKNGSNPNIGPNSPDSSDMCSSSDSDSDSGSESETDDFNIGGFSMNSGPDSFSMNMPGLSMTSSAGGASINMPGRGMKSGPSGKSTKIKDPGGSFNINQGPNGTEVILPNGKRKLVPPGRGISIDSGGGWPGFRSIGNRINRSNIVNSNVNGTHYGPNGSPFWDPKAMQKFEKQMNKFEQETNDWGDAMDATMGSMWGSPLPSETKTKKRKKGL